MRTREVGIQEIHHKVQPYEVELIRRDYVANGGWETFLSYEDPKQGLLLLTWLWWFVLQGSPLGCSRPRLIDTPLVGVTVRCREMTNSTGAIWAIINFSYITTYCVHNVIYVITPDILIGLLRLRKCSKDTYRPELLGGVSIVRELHVYLIMCNIWQVAF